MDAGAGAAFILQSNHASLHLSDRRRTATIKAVQKTKAGNLHEDASKADSPTRASIAHTKSSTTATNSSDVRPRFSTSSATSNLPRWQRRASQRIQYLDTSLERHVSDPRPASTSSPRHVKPTDLAPLTEPHLISHQPSLTSDSNLPTNLAPLTSSNLSVFTHASSATVWPSLSAPPHRSSAPPAPADDISGVVSMPAEASNMPSLSNSRGKSLFRSINPLSKHKTAQDHACDRVDEVEDSTGSAKMVGQSVSLLDSAQSKDTRGGTEKKSERRMFSMWKKKKNKGLPEQPTTDGAELARTVTADVTNDPLTPGKKHLALVSEEADLHMSGERDSSVEVPPKLEPRSARSEQNENLGEMCEIIGATRMKKDEMELEAVLSEPMSSFDWDTDDEGGKSSASKSNTFPKLREQLKFFKARSNSQPVATDPEALIRSISAQFPLSGVGGSRANAFKEQADLLELSQTAPDVLIPSRTPQCMANFQRTSVVINRASVLKMFNDPIWQGDSVTGYDFNEQEFVDGSAGSGCETNHEGGCDDEADEDTDKYAQKSKLKSSISMPSVAARAKKDAKGITRDDVDLSPTVFDSINREQPIRDRSFTISPEVSPTKTTAPKFRPTRIPVYNNSTLGKNKSSPDVSTPRSWTSEATMALPPIPPIPPKHMGPRARPQIPQRYFSPVPGLVKQDVYHSPYAAASANDVATPRAYGKGVSSPSEKTSARIAKPYESNEKGKSPLRSDMKHSLKLETQEALEVNDTPKAKHFGRFFGKVRGGPNEAILQKSDRIPQQNSFSVLRHMNASQPVSIGKISEDISGPGKVHDPLPMGLGIMSSANAPSLHQPENECRTYYAGADGSMQHASMVVETGHDDGDAASQWESVLEEQSESSEYSVEDTTQTFRTAQGDSASTFTCEEAVPHPLTVRKQARFIGEIPVMKVSRDSKLVQLANSPSFSPKRDSTFMRRIQEAGQLQQAKTDSHPALRDSPSSTNKFSSSSPNHFSPVVSGSPLKLDTTFTTNPENGRVDSGINMNVVRCYEEDFKPARFGQSPSANSMDSPPHPFMSNTFIQRESGSSSKPSMSISGQVSQKTNLQNLRADLGMDSLMMQAQSDGPSHPNHHYVWNHESIMCHSLHNPQRINDPLPDDKTLEGKINLHKFSSSYFKHDAPIKRGERGVKTIQRCTICRKICCRFAEYLIASNTTSQEVGEAAERLKAKNMVDFFRSAYANGIEAFSTFVKCQECGNKVCPGCATRCGQEMCQVIFCQECGLGAEQCPVHEGF